MTGTETPLKIALRHVREGERRVARQEALMSELQRDGHVKAAAGGQALLANLRRSLALAREHLAFEQAGGRRAP